MESASLITYITIRDTALITIIHIKESHFRQYKTYESLYICRRDDQATNSASIATKRAILADSRLLNIIAQAAQMVTNTYRNGHKTLLAGNGGSAADAQHIAGEFVSRFYFDRPG